MIKAVVNPKCACFYTITILNELDDYSIAYIIQTDEEENPSSYCNMKLRFIDIMEL